MTIRRPLYYVAMVYAGAIFISYYMPPAAGGLVFACLVIFAWGSKGRSYRTFLALLALVFALGWTSLWIQERVIDPMQKLEGEQAVLTGEVLSLSLPQGEGSVRMELKTEEPAGSRLAVSYYLNEEQLAAFPKEACLPGARVTVTGTLEEPEGKRNPNTFDYRLYLKSRGIRMVLKADQIRPGVSPASPVRYRLFLLRERYMDRLANTAGRETADLMQAILFGDKSGIDEDTMEVFQKNGTAHILAVSGLHIGILYGVMMKLWDLLTDLAPSLFKGRSSWRCFITTALFFTAYACLAGFSPSVVRAVLMVLLHSYAQITFRRYDLSCAAFAVGLASMAHNPYILFQAGFQMSFLAILTMSVMLPYVHRLTTGVLAASLAIQVGLGPYMIYQFNNISLIAVFLNVPVIFLAGIIVPLGMAGLVLPFLAAPAGVMLRLLCAVLLKCNDLCQIDQITTFLLASPHPALIAGYYLALAAFASEEGRLRILRKERGKIGASILIVILLSISGGACLDDGYRQNEITFVDVGQGDCIHIRTCGRNYLIDGGGRDRYEIGTKTVKPYLLKNGVRTIDGAFVTHLHTDHYRGICELAKAGMVRRIFVYESNRLKQDQICRETGLDEDRITYLRAGLRVKLSRRAYLDVLWPEAQSEDRYRQMIENEEDENASSLIMKVSVNGVSLMATGDLGEDGEREILAACRDGADPSGPLQSDILKVGHHGSGTSSCREFLGAVRLAFAVIQVGENNMYGHPTPETLGRLRARGIPVWRNDLQGAVGMRVSGGAVRSIMTMIRDPERGTAQGRKSLFGGPP